jgi:tetratricopeptide (TPR) repeat protein
MRRRHAALVFALAVLAAGLAACQSSQGARAPTAAPEARPQLFDGIGPHSRPVATLSPQGQRYFDQGLAFAFAFNHDEARRAFIAVTELCPESPMGYWGLAYCLGPHINNPLVPPERERSAWEAARRAVALQASASPADRALIAAVARRYTDSASPDRAALDRAYAEGMRAAWAAHPDDADVGALCAEALMDLHPWDLWTVDGQPKEGALEIVALLDSVLRLDPQHPCALHLYIHAVEASNDPGRALAAADRLRPLMPVSGHMLHMPSHIDVLLGHWDEAIACNQRSLAADAAYCAVRPEQDFHHVYMAHNRQMLAFAAMMDGRQALALEAADGVVPGVPEDYARRQTAFIEPYLLIPYETYVRFGLWDRILSEPPPPDYLLIKTALWHFMRGAAFAAQGQVAEAETEAARLHEAAAKVPGDRMVSVNPAHKILEIAQHVLGGEISYRKGDVDAAVAALRQAVAIEDQLVYMEPPEWILPVRHTLGAILLASGRVDEAETAYRDDLAQWPDNGWSLYGLSECLKSRGESARPEAQQAAQRFERAWADADVTIGASCLCVRPPTAR